MNPRYRYLTAVLLSLLIVAARDPLPSCTLGAPDCGTLRVSLYPPSASADIYVDGVRVAVASGAAQLGVPAGQHRVEARAVKGGFAAAVTTTVFDGWTRNLVLDVSAPPDGQALRNSYSWRIGVGVPESTAEAQWVARLGAGWWYDWRMRPNVGGARGEYWQMIRLWECRLNPGPEAFALEARRRPGQVWLIGNEPDVAEQDNVSPECVAELYHQAYTALKAADPRAVVAVGGVAQVTPLRLEYLDRVLAAYRANYGVSMPVDHWTVHAYILREERGAWGVGIPTGLTQEAGWLVDIEDHDDIDLFRQQVVEFRRWMAERGYRTVPLSITEYGILMPADFGFTPERVARFLTDTFDYLLQARDPALGLPSDDNRLVQRWAWFSMSYPPFPTGDLFDAEQGSFTELGSVFRDYVSRLR